MGILDSKICMQYWLLTFHIRGPQGEFPYQGTAGRVSISGDRRESFHIREPQGEFEANTVVPFCTFVVS